ALLASAALLMPPPMAGAVMCRRVCRPAIQRCVAAGGKRRHCKRQLIQQCRQLGQQSCDEAFLSTTTLPPTSTSTTTTTLSPPATTSTRPSGTVTTTTTTTLPASAGVC